VDLLGSDDRKTFCQIETHLMSEHRSSPNPSAVRAVDTLIHYTLKEVKVLTHMVQMKLLAGSVATS